MRSFIALVLAAATVALAAGAFVPNTHEVKYADKDFLHKQEDLLILLRHVYQPDWNQQLVYYAKNYHINESYSHYTNVEYVQKFWSMWEHGFLPKGEVFNVYNEVHRDEAIALFHVFYYAEDWATFYKSVAWARYYVNEGQFVYALTVAVTHRKDFAGFFLPAPYEIFPYYFINSEVIQRAQQYKMQGYYGMKQTNGVYETTIYSNYTGHYIHTNPEQKISYFTEDVGLNAYYYYFHIDYPFWMGGKEFGLVNDRRGELYLFEHQQLLARYYLERLSNSLGHIPEISYTVPLQTGYYPSLTYYNGHVFPDRENYYNFYTEDHYYDVELIHDYEHRIREAIDYGFIFDYTGKQVFINTPAGIEYLGNMIQANPDSPNYHYYKYVAYFARVIFGAAVEPVDHFQEIPSVLEHFETAMRDPVFYQLYKRIMKFYWQFKETLKPYTYHDLEFTGVKLTKVEVDKLVTYFDHFDIDITNAIDIEPEPYVEGKYTSFGEIEYKPDPVVIKSRNYRLNHKAFSYKIHVTAENAVKGVVRVFIGPKFDEYGNVYHLNENRENFFELDYFVQDFTAGKNVIVRQSVDFNGYVRDRTTFYDLYKKVMTAYTSDVKFPMDMSEAHCGFPHRLMLPKGSKGGFNYQFFFIVSEYHAPPVEVYTGFDATVSCGVGSGARYYDSLPFGYPFDRHVDEYTFYHLDNMHFEDVFIFHRDEVDINTVY